MKDIYEQLRDRLDSMSYGYTASNGGDVALLKTLFTDEEVAYALELATDRFESAAELAERMGRTLEDTERNLDHMADNGLAFFRREDGIRKYRFMPFMFGILDLRVHRPMDGRAMGQLHQSEFGGMLWQTETPMFYYVPVNNELVVDSQILPRDDAWQIIDGKDPNRIALTDCACRANMARAGKPCVHEGFDEACLYFDDFADYFVERGDARYITKEEAKELLRKAEKEGLVIETVNTEASAVECICMCCSCCCGPLRRLRANIETAEAIHMASNHYIVKDDEKCVNCGVCVSRCPVIGMSMKDGICTYNPNACIGCGLCVSTCGAGALSLHQKPAELQNHCESKDVHELHTKLQTEYRERLAR